MDYKDYYRVLGVDRNASQDEIRRAYRKLAMRYHPDHNQGDSQAEERFKEINEAYQVLSDEQKRAHYDQLGESYSRWQQSGAPGDFNWSDWFNAGGAGTRVEYGDLFGRDSVFSDFFSAIFGGMGTPFGGAARQSAPQSYQQPVTISLPEAYNGTTRRVKRGDKTIQVKIPPGARTGTKVRVAGAGPTAPDGRRGDLYLLIEVAPDSRFEREGADLHSRVQVDLPTAVLGGEVEVETLNGNVLLTIPPGTQPEQTFRLTGRGMPQLKSPNNKGDLYVRVKVMVPRKLTRRQKELFMELIKEGPLE